MLTKTNGYTVFEGSYLLHQYAPFAKFKVHNAAQEKGMPPQKDKLHRNWILTTYIISGGKSQELLALTEDYPTES